jgi:drug/metabolite transporter (DMT)-like permease
MPVLDETRTTDAQPASAAAPASRTRHVTRARHRLLDTRALAILLCAVWGTTFIVQRLALEVAPPLWVAALRLVVASAVLLPFAGSLRGLDRRGVAFVVSLGLCQTAFIGCQVAGLKTIGAGPAAAIIYLQPVLVVLLAAPVLGEHLTPRRLAGALVGFAGVAIVSVHQADAANAAGVALLLGAALAWTIGTLATSTATRPIVALVVAQHLVAAPILLALAAAAEPFPALSVKLVVGVVFAGAFGSALAWMLLTTLLRRGEAGVVSTWLFAVPILAAVLGVLALGEPVSAALVVGIVLVAIAVRLAAPSSG